MERHAIVLGTARVQLREVTLSDAALARALPDDPSWLESIGDLD